MKVKDVDCNGKTHATLSGTLQCKFHKWRRKVPLHVETRVASKTITQYNSHDLQTQYMFMLTTQAKL
jgi:ribosomal protein S3AE